MRPWLPRCYLTASFWRVFYGCHLAVAFVLPVGRGSLAACWPWPCSCLYGVSLSLPFRRMVLACLLRVPSGCGFFVSMLAVALSLPVGRGFFAACRAWLSRCHEAAVLSLPFRGIVLACLLWVPSCRRFFCCLLCVALSLPVGRGFFAAMIPWLSRCHEPVTLSVAAIWPLPFGMSFVGAI